MDVTESCNLRNVWDMPVQIKSCDVPMTRYILHNWKDTWTPQPLGQLGSSGDPLTLLRNLSHRPFQETECHQRTWGKFMRSYIWINDTERWRESVSEQTSGKALRVGMHWFRPVSLPQYRHVNSSLESRQHYSPFSLKGKRERGGKWVWAGWHFPMSISLSVCYTHAVRRWDELIQRQGTDLIWCSAVFSFLKKKTRFTNLKDALNDIKVSRILCIIETNVLKG